MVRQEEDKNICTRRLLAADEVKNIYEIRKKEFFGKWDPGHQFELKYVESKMRNVARIQMVSIREVLKKP